MMCETRGKFDAMHRSNSPQKKDHATKGGTAALLERPDEWIGIDNCARWGAEVTKEKGVKERTQTKGSKQAAREKPAPGAKRAVAIPNIPPELIAALAKDSRVGLLLRRRHSNEAAYQWYRVAVVPETLVDVQREELSDLRKAADDQRKRVEAAAAALKEEATEFRRLKQKISDEQRKRGRIPRKKTQAFRDADIRIIRGMLEAQEAAGRGRGAKSRLAKSYGVSLRTLSRRLNKA